MATGKDTATDRSGLAAWDRRLHAVGCALYVSETTNDGVIRHADGELVETTLDAATVEREIAELEELAKLEGQAGTDSEPA